MLKISDLHSGYANEDVIRGISFNLKESEFVSIIGPNGSGKTTLFRTICKIIPGYRGQLLYKDKELRTWSIRTLAREIAVVPQFILLNPSISSGFNVREFIALGRTPYTRRFKPLSGRDYEMIDEAVRITECRHLQDRSVTELSGGELQRVFLAQALAQEPKLLLLDEPISHLDIGHQVEILQVLKRLNKERGLTIVVILHDLNVAADYSDRLILLDNGRIHSSGSPSEVLTYQNIETVYKTIVVVHDNPVTKKPHVLVVPK